MEEKHLAETIRSAIDEALSRLFEEKMQAYIQQLLEGEFYKELTIELKEGLNEIYHSLANLRETIGNVGLDADSANMVFQEASDQLDAILRATEKATGQIMDITEEFQGRLTAMSEVVEGLDDSLAKERLKELIAASSNDCLSIITACSFQDITGQRVKKVIDALHEIEEKLLEILVSAGVKIKAKKEGRDEMEIEQETRKAVDLLKGPQEGVDQSSVDELLAELGI